MLFAANVAHAQKYPIRLFTPDPVGQRYTISATGGKVQTATAIRNGSVIRTQTSTAQVTFEGRAEVLAVDAKGQPFKVSYTVARFTKTENGVTTVVLKPGTTILTDGSLEREKQIRLKDGPMDEATAEEFRLVISVHRANSPTDDDIFGSKEPRAIGERWSINNSIAAADFSKIASVSPDKVRGSASLIAKGIVDGNECLIVTAEVSADDMALPKAPPGFAPDRGSVQANFRGCFTTNPSAGAGKGGAELNAQFRFKGAPGSGNEGVVLEATVTQFNSTETRNIQE
jgi:hypothetical protein